MCSDVYVYKRIWFQSHQAKYCEQHISEILTLLPSEVLYCSLCALMRGVSGLVANVLASMGGMKELGILVSVKGKNSPRE